MIHCETNLAAVTHMCNVSKDIIALIQPNTVVHMKTKSNYENTRVNV